MDLIKEDYSLQQKSYLGSLKLLLDRENNYEDANAVVDENVWSIALAFPSNYAEVIKSLREYIKWKFDEYDSSPRSFLRTLKLRLAKEPHYDDAIATIDGNEWLIQLVFPSTYEAIINSLKEIVEKTFKGERVEA